MTPSMGERLAALAPDYPDDFAARLLGQTMTIGKRRSCGEVLRTPWHEWPYDEIARQLLKESAAQPELVWRCTCIIAKPGRSLVTALDSALLVLEREDEPDARRLTRAIARVEWTLLSSGTSGPFATWLVEHTPAMAAISVNGFELRADVAETLRHIDWRRHEALQAAIRLIPARVADEHELAPVIRELLSVASTGVVLTSQRARINLALWGAFQLCRFPHHERSLAALKAAWEELEPSVLLLA